MSAGDEGWLMTVWFCFFEQKWFVQGLAKKRSKRHKLCLELLETEITYVQKLGGQEIGAEEKLESSFCCFFFVSGVTQIILEPLEWNAQISPEPLLPKNMIAEIFSNIKQLYALNKTLLHDLDERIKRSWSPQQKVFSEQ